MRHWSTLSFLLLGCCLAVSPFIGCAAITDVRGDLAKAELLSRDKYRSYDDATFSFEHGLRNDPDLSITKNDWDIEFGNGGDVFGVTMVTDDRSRLVDLGPLTWEETKRLNIMVPAPHPSPTREPTLPVVEGHMYLVRTVDRDTDLTALLRVENLRKGDRVTFTWRRLSASS